VVACEIADVISMSEIGIAINRGNRTAIIDNFRSYALGKLKGAKKRAPSKRG
jgi:hypothetical protein